MHVCRYGPKEVPRKEDTLLQVQWYIIVAEIMHECGIYTQCVAECDLCTSVYVYNTPCRVD